MTQVFQMHTVDVKQKSGGQADRDGAPLTESATRKKVREKAKTHKGGIFSPLRSHTSKRVTPTKRGGHEQSDSVRCNKQRRSETPIEDPKRVR